MKRKLGLFLSFILIVCGFINFHNSKKPVDAAEGSYYSSVSGKTGDSLLEGLASLSKSKHTSYTTYGDLKNMFASSDYASSGKIYDFYTQTKMSSSWSGGHFDREHVWCQSLSGNLYTSISDDDVGAGADLHHIRPTYDNINSSRGNKKYAEISGGTAKYYSVANDSVSNSTSSDLLYGYTSGDYFEPISSVKGDVARILMYMYMHYSKEVSANSSHYYAGALSITNIVYTSSGTSDSAFNLLCTWNSSDPVSSQEMTRNEYVAGVTGIRNPFIDHPEYADAIWGDASSGGSTSTPDSGNDSSSSTTPPSSGENTGTTTPPNSSTGGNGQYDSTTETITSTVYRKLKSASGITVGSKIIIAASDYNVAMSTNQKTSNRGQTTISKSSSGSYDYLTPSSSTQILEVKSGDNTSGYTLYTGDGYLVASGGDSSNKLTTKASITSDKIARWTIHFSSGNADIVCVDSSTTKNTIRYNSTYSLFSCYESGQQDVSIYKEYTETTSITYTFPESESLITISKANEVANKAGSSYSASKYKIQGTISSISNTTYGNMTVSDSLGNSIYVYGVYGSDGTRYDSLGIHQPQVGDTVMLFGTLGTYNGSPQMKNASILNLSKQTSASNDLNSLLNKYISDGKYTKISNIYLSEEAQQDISLYFHANIVDKERITYYNQNALWMTNSTGSVNSGYGTDAFGDMTHFKLNNDGSQTIDYTIDMPNKGGMEEYYDTPNDFLASSYYDSNWVYLTNVGYVYDLAKYYEGNTKAAKYLEEFINVAAPLLLTEVYTSNYLRLDKLIITEVNNQLMFAITVNSTSSGVLDESAKSELLLCKSLITAGCSYSFN